MTRFVQSFEACGAGVGLFFADLPKYWSAYGETRAFVCRSGNFNASVTGDSYRYIGAHATLIPNLSDFGWGDVVRAQVYALRSAGQGDIGAGVYEKTSF
jgi:hypothetical protein